MEMSRAACGISSGRRSRWTKCRSGLSPTAFIPLPGLRRVWASLYQRYLGDDWYAHLDEPETWDQYREIPDGELWEAHRELKADLIAYARERLARQRTRVGEGMAAVDARPQHCWIHRH